MSSATSSDTLKLREDTRKALPGILDGNDEVGRSARGTRGVKWTELVKAGAEQCKG
jgi:hypothetical protein